MIDHAELRAKELRELADRIERALRLISQEAR